MRVPSSRLGWRCKWSTAECARVLAFAWALGLPAGGNAQSSPDLGFTTKVGAGLITQLTQKFTAKARDLLEPWIAFAAQQKGVPLVKRLEAAKGREAEVLESVNDYLNRIPYFEDIVHWGQDDYWATPAESAA